MTLLNRQGKVPPGRFSTTAYGQEAVFSPPEPRSRDGPGGPAVALLQTRDHVRSTRPFVCFRNSLCPPPPRASPSFSVPFPLTLDITAAKKKKTGINPLPRRQRSHFGPIRPNTYRVCVWGMVLDGCPDMNAPSAKPGMAIAVPNLCAARPPCAMDPGRRRLDTSRGYFPRGRCTWGAGVPEGCRSCSCSRDNQYSYSTPLRQAVFFRRGRFRRRARRLTCFVGVTRPTARRRGGVRGRAIARERA